MPCFSHRLGAKGYSSTHLYYSSGKHDSSYRCSPVGATSFGKHFLQSCALVRYSNMMQYELTAAVLGYSVIPHRLKQYEILLLRQYVAVLDRNVFNSKAHSCYVVIIVGAAAWVRWYFAL